MIYLFDAGEEAELVGAMREQLETHGSNYLLVGNKIDRYDEAAAAQRFPAADKTIFISAREQLHLDTLRRRMVDTVLQGSVQTENTIITNARHYHALKEMDRSLNDIRAGLANQLPGDLLALDIRRCLHYLGEITGEVTNEDTLDYIFSKFCIGK